MQGNHVVVIQMSRRRWLWLEDPVEIVAVRRRSAVRRALERVEHAVNAGFYAAGFLAYEAASSFDAALRTNAPGALPLVWFGLYRKVRTQRELSGPDGRFVVGKWRPSVSRAEYARNINMIKHYLAAGDTYQVNYTLRMRASFQGDPYAFFLALCRAQPSRHAAFLLTDEFAICSASPELFFALNGTRVVARPMKGTARRGCTWEEDERHAKELQTAAKSRAENVMIVDMIRNDLGRIAEPGSVRVVSAFDVERYPTVLQMTSTVAARTTARVVDIMAALFPCASVTGAPKARTMEIIRELEPDPRGLYTGAIGYILPGRKAKFSVAIRTVVINRRQGVAEYGTGGGVVWDSVTDQEYAECLEKTRVLTEPWPEFELLESLLWTPKDGYFLLEAHLQRMRDSARYFDFPFPRSAVIRRLQCLAASLTPSPHKVRLRLNQFGKIMLDVEPLARSLRRKIVRLALARAPVDSKDRFLYHKTTYRKVYEQARQAHPACEDVLLYNERGEVTETTVANVAFKFGNRWVTPPIACGLLAGTFRQHLIEQGRVVEEAVPLARLPMAKGVAVFNSVRWWQPARLIQTRRTLG